MKKDLSKLHKIAELEESHQWGQWAVEKADLGGYSVYITDEGLGRSYVATDIGQGESGGKSTAEFIATFDPNTVLALLTRLEQVEKAVARVREAATGDPTEYGWSEAILAVLRALDGEPYE